MNRIRLIVAESLRSLASNLSTTVAATMTVLIGMFLVGLALALGSWMHSWSEDVKSRLEVKVYFKETATPVEMNALRVKLESSPLVRDVDFVSKEEAIKRMRKKFPELTENLT